jgi:hypothetical protein
VVEVVVVDAGGFLGYGFGGGFDGVHGELLAQFQRILLIS